MAIGSSISTNYWDCNVFIITLLEFRKPKFVHGTLFKITYECNVVHRDQVTLTVYKVYSLTLHLKPISLLGLTN